MEFAALAAGLEASTAITFGDAPIAREMVSLEADELRGSYENGAVVIAGASASTSGLGTAKLSLSGRMPNGDVSLRLTGEAGRTYLIETSADLQSWAEWKTVTLTGTDVELLDAEARNWPRRFYRARLAP